MNPVIYFLVIKVVNFTIFQFYSCFSIWMQMVFGGFERESVRYMYVPVLFVQKCYMDEEEMKKLK